jgi:hypothetical protein
MQLINYIIKKHEANNFEIIFYTAILFIKFKTYFILNWVYVCQLKVIHNKINNGTRSNVNLRKTADI